MITFRTIQGAAEVETVLIEFLPCFPHLPEKIASMSEYAEKLSRFAEVVVMAIDEKTAGLAVFYDNDQGGTAYISLIGIKEAYRKSGFGSRLLSHVEKAAAEKGMILIRLEVDDDNLGAQKFYQKHGFEFSDRASETSMHLTKKI